MTALYRLKKQWNNFRKQTDGVIDLPMRIVVSLIIGMVCLAAILSFFIQPNFYNPEPLITVSPTVAIINETNSKQLFIITVLDEKSHNLPEALVIFHSDFFIQTNKTNSNGQTTLLINATTTQHLYEAYIDVTVKAQGFQTFYQQDMIKLIYQ